MKDIIVANATLLDIEAHKLPGATFKSTAVDNGDGTSTMPISDDVAERLDAIHPDPDIAIQRLFAGHDGRLN